MVESLQVGEIIVFGLEMFGRIYAISHGVRAYFAVFAPEPSAFARRSATRGFRPCVFLTNSLTSGKKMRGARFFARFQ